MSNETYKLLADIVWIIHMMVVFVLCGSLLWAYLAFFRKIYWPYIVCTALSVVTGISQLVFLGCPLTILEYELRSVYDPHVNVPKSFIVENLYKLAGINVESLTVSIVVWLTLITSIAAFAVYKAGPRIKKLFTP